MAGEEFRTSVQTYICPILAGAVLTPELQEVEKGQVHALAALKNNGQAMHISPGKKTGYKVEIRRNQPFNDEDIKPVEAIVSQIIANYSKAHALYQERVISYAIEVGQCKFLCAPEYAMLASVLDGSRTGRPAPTRGASPRLPSWSILRASSKSISSTRPSSTC